MKTLIDRCPSCGSPIYEDEEEKRFYTCSCLEAQPCCCSDGACESMCICEKNEEE